MNRKHYLMTTCTLALLVMGPAKAQLATATLLDAASEQVLQSVQPAPNTLPVGSIVASMLTEAQFQRLTGAGWILADGRDAASSLYGRLTNRQSVPDLRGVFLRGQNNNRNDSKQNPDLKQLGEYQADAVGNHSHSVLTPGGVDGNRSGRQDAWYGGGQGSTGTCCGTETRPRNVTVNYFIRIN